MTATPIFLAVPDLPHEAELVERLTRPGTSVSVVRRCMDSVDLIGAAMSGAAAVAVVSAGLPRLGRETLARLAAAQVTTVGIALDGDDEGMRTLRALDLPVITVPTDDLDAAVAALARAAEGGTPAPRHDAPAREAIATRGSLMAVWGPTGAPGRTTIAIGLADEMSRAGTPALLVDADTYGGSVATQLGLLDDVSGIVLACRRADAGALDDAGLASAARSLDTRLRVLTGIASAARWPELRSAALGRLWEVCRSMPGVTVVDAGFGLERDEELLHDTRTPRRNAATLTALEAADVVIAVGSADPVGIERLIAGLDDLRRVVPEAPVRVVVTRVRSSVLGRAPEAQIQEALRVHAGVTDVTCIPDDRAAFDLCLREGRTLAEVAPKSPARRVLREFARACATPAVARSGVAA
jgi:Flp pilus assembly CpaE family ATPase